MVHLAIMRFQEGALTHELLAHIKRVFSDIQEGLECCSCAQVYENSVARSTNYDIMVRLEMTGQDALQEYLEYPLHVALQQELKPLLCAFCTFDYLPHTA